MKTFTCFFPWDLNSKTTFRSSSLVISAAVIHLFRLIEGLLYKRNEECTVTMNNKPEPLPHVSHIPMGAEGRKWEMKKMSKSDKCTKVKQVNGVSCCLATGDITLVILSNKDLFRDWTKNWVMGRNCPLRDPRQQPVWAKNSWYEDWRERPIWLPLSSERKSHFLTRVGTRKTGRRNKKAGMVRFL